MKKYLSAMVIALAAAGCSYESKTTLTDPSSNPVASLIGSWTSASASLVPAAATCTDFKWNPTEQTGTSAKGSFSARCAGDLQLEGTAAGTLNGTTIAWSANGAAKSPVIPTCAVSLAGTAELGLNSIRVPYSGTTCLGPVSGVEVLNRR